MNANFGRGFGRGMMFGGQGLITIALMIIIIALQVYLILKLVPRKKVSSKKDDRSKALELLDEKLVKGEISDDDYNTKKKLLLGLDETIDEKWE